MLNSKYHYAVLSLDSASHCLKVRNKPYYSLLRRLAAITKDNDDHKRSIEYHKNVLEKYVKENKTNEVGEYHTMPDLKMRYVCETMSNLYLELGDFRRAETYLLMSLDTIPQVIRV